MANRSARARSGGGDPRTREDARTALFMLVGVGLLLVVIAILKPDAPEPGSIASPERQQEVAAEQAAALPVDLLGIGRPVDRPMRVLFIGDSLADAAGATTRDKGFVSQLTGRLQAGGPIESTVVAMPGQTTRTVAAELPQGYQEVTIVELGTNDVGRTSVPQFASDYAALMSGVREQSPGGLLMCLGPWMPQAEAAEYDQVAREACEGAGGVYVTLSWAYVKDQYRDDSYDQFHPDNDGHTFITNEVLRWAIPDEYKAVQG